MLIHFRLSLLTTLEYLEKSQAHPKWSVFEAASIVCDNSSLQFINPTKLLCFWQPAKLSMEHNFVIDIRILKWERNQVLTHCFILFSTQLTALTMSPKPFCRLLSRVLKAKVWLKMMQNILKIRVLHYYYTSWLWIWCYSYLPYKDCIN